MYRLVFFILLIFAGVFTKAQPLYTSGIDSLLRTEYDQKRWKSIMHLTDSLHKIDMGYHEAYEMAADAAFMLNKPFKQQNYLEHALHNYPTDSAVLYKLSQCLWQTQQYNHAVRLQHQLTKTCILHRSDKIKSNVIHVDFGSKVSNNTSLYNNMNFVFIGSAFAVKSLLTYHGITYLTQRSFYGSMMQAQYYFNTGWAMKNGWKIYGIVHALKYNITHYSSDLSGNQILSGSPIVYGGGVSKLYKNISLNIDAIKGDLNHNNQLQVTPSASYYPLSNNKIILYGSVNYLTEKSHVITSAQLTVAPTKSLKITTGYLHANARNFTEQHAFLVHNSFDITKNRYSITLMQKVSSGLSISGIFQLENKIETFTNTPYQYTLYGLGLRNIF